MDSMLENAYVDFICKSNQIKEFIEIAKTYYRGSEAQNILGLVEVLVNDLTETETKNYESLLTCNVS
jgi:hypothetical protein